MEKRDNKKISTFRHILASVLYRYGKILPDGLYLRLLYYAKFKKKLRLRHPITFNEKLQWLKLNYRKPDMTVMVDKIEVKKWIRDRLKTESDKLIIPTIEVYEKADDIDFNKLTDRFVLKCNHDSGGICICKNKKEIDFEEVKRRLGKTLKRDYYSAGREWPYKNVSRRVLAEKYLEDESGYELKDYKIFCFNGEPHYIQVDFDRFADSGHKRNIYDTDWNYMDVELQYPTLRDHQICRPSSLDEMLRISKLISQDFPFVRVDFYDINGELKFGEITFYPGSGLESFSDENWDIKLGNMIKLPNGK